MPSRLPFTPAPIEIVEKILARKEIDENGCWNWPGATGNGYGRVYTKDGLRYVHRVIYGALVGPIPDRLVIDHLCRNKVCFRPSHLEAVTDGTNTTRGLHSALKQTCKRGHPWIPENRYEYPKKTGGVHRFCRICHLERHRKAA